MIKPFNILDDLSEFIDKCNGSGNENGISLISIIEYTALNNLLQLIDIIGNLITLYILEPNDNITRNQLSNFINSYLGDMKAHHKIHDYEMACNEINNTPERIARNELWLNMCIHLQTPNPTNPADYFVYGKPISGFNVFPKLIFVVHPSNVDISFYTDYTHTWAWSDSLQIYLG